MDAKEEKTVKHSIDTVNEVVQKIRDTNDEILSSISNLKIVLLNLQIENARIRENTGIDPIADELRRIIIRMEESVKHLIEGNRERLKESLKAITDYINQNEE